MICMTTLAWINTQTNVCDNTTLDDRPASEFQIEGYLILDLDAIGGGGIGDTWDGQKLSKPSAVDQPSISEIKE